MPGRYLRAVRRAGEFGERDPDTIMGRHLEGDLVVAETQVLHELVSAAIVRSEPIALIPRTGRSLDLSRP